ncbi:MAG: glycosyltransferase [Verrucomicrobia bacterium]|nr:glycosyltransferase [Verrucomicrobiota bacterium]
MKICFLLSTFAYDGIKRSVVHFANAMQDMGHEVWVGVLHEWPGKVSLRSELRLPAERVVSWDGLGQGWREWAIYRFLRAHRFDVVHANTVKMNHLGRWLALAARVPCVIASEDNLCLNRSWRTRTEERLLARLGHGVVMISDAVARSFIEVEKLPREKVRTIYYGLPIEAFQAGRRSTAELEAKRREIGVPPGPTVVCAARLHFSKSLDTLVRAARGVVDRLPNAQFILAGDGEERAKLDALRDELRLRGNFHLIGARTDVYDILQLSDVVTLCSLWEGLGFSLMEAMAFGKPLVGTDVSGINEIIFHNRNGLLVPPQAPEKLGAALHTVLTDTAIARQLSDGTAAVLTERFDVRRNAQKLVEFYQTCLRR